MVGAEKMKGRTNPFYKLRTGDYRIIFEAPDNHGVLWIALIGDRKEIYEMTP